MGHFPRVLLYACLYILKYLFAVTGGLMLILLVVQQVRGDVEAAPVALGIGTCGMAALAWISGRGATYFRS
ncbi:MAG: hypothetical protein LCH61_01485 [Proteobacteria bacterium]|nr:hypothetical protein [Pseudomonadota bacterium]